MNAKTMLYAAIKDFPEPVLVEVIEFTEFLRAKRLNPNPPASDESLMTLSGGLEKSNNFVGDPLALQARMRDEWN
jgi:hypothetical protein